MWTSLIVHAFLDAYERFKNETFLNADAGSCDRILHDLETFADGEGACISYIPIKNSQAHNANTLGGNLLARTYSFRAEPGRRLDAEAGSMHGVASEPDASW